MYPGRSALRCTDLRYRHRMPVTCGAEGAVETTKVSSVGWVATQWAISRAAMWLFPEEWQDRTAVLRWSRMEVRISSCLDHVVSWSLCRIHPGPSSAQGSGSGSSTSATL